MKRRLTDQQRLMVESHYRLIPYVLHRHFSPASSDWDDMMQIGAMGLCKAAQTYAPEKGTFATWACKCILNEVRMDIRHRHAARRDERRLASLDGSPFPDEDASFAPKTACLELVEDAVAYRQLQGIIGAMGGRDGEIIRMSVRGLSQQEIADAIGVRQPQVSKIVKRIRRQIASMLELDGWA